MPYKTSRQFSILAVVAFTTAPLPLFAESEQDGVGSDVPAMEEETTPEQETAISSTVESPPEPTILVIVDRRVEEISNTALLALRGLIADLSVRLDTHWVDGTTTDLVRSRALAEQIAGEQSAVGVFWIGGEGSAVFLFLPGESGGRVYQRSFTENEEVFAETFALIVRSTTIVLLHEDRGRAREVIEQSEWDDASDAEPLEPEPEPELEPEPESPEEGSEWHVGLGLKLVGSFRGVGLGGGPSLSFDWVHRSGLLVGLEAYGGVFGGSIEYGGAEADLRLIGVRLQLGYAWTPHRLLTLRPTVGLGALVVAARGVPQPLLIDHLIWSIGFHPSVATTVALQLTPHLRLSFGIAVSFTVPSFAVDFEVTNVATFGPVFLEGCVGLEIFW